mmetsp:Transcript_14806/g.51599  ORF Transcript_14806/g.51599 Transcript_14806/m.51599 type:complete len:200 (+) Transcript_14806:61-660(+)
MHPASVRAAAAAASLAPASLEQLSTLVTRDVRSHAACGRRHRGLRTARRQRHAPPLALPPHTAAAVRPQCRQGRAPTTNTQPRHRTAPVALAVVGRTLPLRVRRRHCQQQAASSRVPSAGVRLPHASPGEEGAGRWRLCAASSGVRRRVAPPDVRCSCHADEPPPAPWLCPWLCPCPASPPRHASSSPKSSISSGGRAA